MRLAISTIVQGEEITQVVGGELVGPRLFLLILLKHSKDKHYLGVYSIALQTIQLTIKESLNPIFVIWRW